MSLRDDVIKLAHENPALRGDLIPLLRMSRSLPGALASIPIQDMQSVVNLLTYIQRLPQGERTALLREADGINQRYMAQFGNMQTLYHGAPSKIVDLIRHGGFRLTQGLRTVGPFGADKKVQNQAIFLSTDKSLARAFGENRDDGGRGEVLEVKADVQKTLDMTSWGGGIPKKLRDLGLALLKDYYGVVGKRPTQGDLFWLIDQPEFVGMARDLGFDSAEFSESTATKKALGLPRSSGNTLAVFDPKRLHLPDPPIKGIQGLFDYLKENVAR